jgi:hypothetical protein
MGSNRKIVWLNEYPGYGVDDLGGIYCRRPRNGKGGGVAEPRLVRPSWDGARRYKQVYIDERKVLVHKLVALAFFGPRPEGKEISHKNGVASDNRATNLEYVTHSENEQMKRRHGTYNSRWRKLKPEQVLQIRARLARGERAYKLAEEYGVSSAAISKIKNGILHAPI